MLLLPGRGGDRTRGYRGWGVLGQGVMGCRVSGLGVMGSGGGSGPPQDWGGQGEEAVPLPALSLPRRTLF